jgi:hypothetical protein
MDHSRRANPDPLAIHFQVLGFPAPDCGCQKTADCSTRRLRTIVQQDAAWKLPVGTTEKVDFTYFPRIANDSRFIENCWSPSTSPGILSLTFAFKCRLLDRISGQGEKE